MHTKHCCKRGEDDYIINDPNALPGRIEPILSPLKFVDDNPKVEHLEQSMAFVE